MSILPVTIRALIKSKDVFVGRWKDTFMQTCWINFFLSITWEKYAKICISLEEIGVMQEINTPINV